MSTGAESEAIVAQGYDAVYRAVPRSPTLWRIWLDHAAGADFPGEYSHISFVTLAELGDLADALRLEAGVTLADIACGMGGPSLWIAAQRSIRLLGVDASPVAIELATTRAARLGLADRASFAVGTFAATRLPDRSADVALSLDALQYAPDKTAALAEIARVLNPDGRLAFTAFEVRPDRVADLPVLGDDPVDDYRPILERAGFTVIDYEETPGWAERVHGAFTAILEQSVTLTNEMGTDAYASLSLETAITLERQLNLRRIVAVATPRARSAPLPTRPPSS